MLTEIELKLTQSFTTLSCATFSIPFDWNTRKPQLKPTKSRLKLGIGYFYFLFATLYAAFAMGQMYRSLQSRAVHAGEIVFNFYFILVHLCSVVFHGSFLYFQRELAQLFNSLLHFNKTFGVVHTGSEFAKPNIREKVFQFFFQQMYFCGVLLFGIFPASPNNSYYIYSLLPEHLKTWQMIFGFAVIEFIVAAKGIIIYTFLLNLLVLYLFTQIHWIRFIRIGLASLEQKLKIYMALQVLSCQFNQIFAKILIPYMKLFCGTVIVVGIFGTIRLAPKLPLTVYLFMPFAGVFVSIKALAGLHVMSAVHQDSEEFRNMSHSNEVGVFKRGQGSESEYLRLKVLALRSIRCNIGSLYFVKTETKLSFLAILVEWSIFLLLNY